MDKFVRTEVLWPCEAIHFARLVGHLAIRLAPISGLPSLNLFHLPFETILGRLGQLVKFDGRVLRELEILALP